MVHIALDAAAATRGLVDPTVGAAIGALGYDRDFDLIDPNAPPTLPVLPEATVRFAFAVGCWIGRRISHSTSMASSRAAQ